MFPISGRARGKFVSRVAMAAALALGVAGGAAVLPVAAVAKDAPP